jgi:WD40 repeat protein
VGAATESAPSLTVGLPPEGGTTNALSNARENTPDKLRRRLQGDLDNIILKAMRKEPEQRYASVEQLSEDIGRYLTGQPVIARKGSTVYRARKFIRRNKTAVAGVTVLVLALLAGLLFAVRQARIAKEEARENRRLVYPARLQKAQEAFAAGDYEQMQAALDEFAPKPGQSEEDLRGFEWRYLWRLIHRDLATFRHANQVGYAEFFDHGRKLLTVSDDQSARDKDGVAVRKDCVARSWDVETGRELRSFSLDNGRTPFAGHRFGDDGKIILRSEEDRAFKLWDFETGQLISTITDGLARNQRIPVGGGAQMMASGSDDGTLSLRDVVTGKVIAVLRGHSVPIQDVVIWPDKNRALVRSNGVDLKLWDWDSKLCLATVRETDGIGFKLLAHNGKWLFTLVGDRTLRVRETTRFREIASHTEASDKILGVQMFNSSDRLITVSTDGAMKIWRLPTLQQIAVIKAHEDWIGFLHYTPDEKTILTAGNDRTAKLWDAATYRELGVARGHTGEVRGAIPSGDSLRIVTWGNDHTARAWDVATLLEPDKITGHTGWVFSVAFSPDGQRLATASQDGTAKIWDIKTGQSLATLRGHTQWVFCIASSPDGRLIATAGADKTARIWDAQTGREIHTLTGHQFQIHGLAFSPDGQTLATASDDRTVRLWDVATGGEQRVIQAHPGEIYAVAFSPDGRLLATGGWDHTVKLWNVQTGQHVATFTGHTEAVWSLKFSPDGRRLASASRDKTAIVWDVAAGQSLLTLKGHFDEIFSVAFSPDGKRLATGSNDKTVRIWNATTGQELLTLKDHTDQVWSVAFSPDGRTLASGSWDKTARLYRAAGEEEVRACSQR